MVDLLIRRSAQNPSMHMIVPLRSNWNTAALLIHMGRDHGLAAYPEWVKMCHSSQFDADIKGFEDLGKMGISKENVEMLKELYRLVLSLV